MTSIIHRRNNKLKKQQVGGWIVLILILALCRQYILHISLVIVPVPIQVVPDNNYDYDIKIDDESIPVLMDSNKLGLYKPSNVIRRFWSCNSKEEHRRKDNTDIDTDTDTIASSRRRKLIFIHVFKTAGSSFRSFFHQYAKICQRKSVTLICTDLASKYLQPTHNYDRNSNSSHPPQLEYWKTRHGKDCELKLYTDGTKHTRTTTTTDWDSNSNLSFTVGRYPGINYDVLQKVNLDILIGHMPFGLHEHWNVNVDANADANAEVQYYSSTKKNRSGSGSNHSTSATVPTVSTTTSTVTTTAAVLPVEPLYITFFRNPLHKYVSGRLFVNRSKQWTFEEALLAIQQLIMDTDYYEGYSKYLLTPYQKENIKKNDNKKKTNRNSYNNRTMTTTKINALKFNLLSQNVIIGIVEEMKDSLQLIRYAINNDGNRQIDRLLNSLLIGGSDSGSGDGGGTSSARRLNNSSAVSVSTTATDNSTVKTKKNQNNKPTKKGLVINQSSLSTTDLVRELKKNQTVFDKMKQMLRYENELYHFAQVHHQLQVQYLRSVQVQ